MSLHKIIAITMDGQSICLNQVLRHAKNHQTFDVVQSKVRQVIMERYASANAISVSGDELQQGIDDYRRSHGLLQVAAATEWLQRNKMTLDDLAESIRDQLIEFKVMENVCRDQVEQHFYENRLSFDSAILSQIVMKEYGAARELMYRIEEGSDFHTLARRYSIDETTRRSGGYAGEVTRSSMSPVEAAAVFGARADEVVGPIQTIQGLHVIKVEEIKSARLDERLKREISSIVFEEWVDEQLNKAAIEIPLWDQV